MIKIFNLRNLACAAMLSCGLWAADTVWASELTVTGTAQAGAFALVDGDGAAATVVYDAADGQVVGTAAEMLSGDVKLITGKELTLATELSGVKMPVIAGTVGQSRWIDGLAEAGKINVADVEGKWEAYALEIVDNPMESVDRALVAYGGTPRGTAYALLEISRRAGVSPYVWWADVLPEEQSALYASGDRVAVGEPSVRFRGIFINDEDWGLQPWAAKNLDKKYNNVGPNTYAKVMDLLLRLRANVLWPAMHLCSQAFWDNKDNLPVAKKYDIALGSSHCEQMLRDNEWEWRRFEDGSGTYDNWNYVTNKDKIQRYWEERVEESKGYDAMYTLGMRGVHDWAISGYPSTQDKVRGLTEIISFQRSLIEKHIGDPTTVPQIFIPYKEVLDAYNAGLQVPEDVILTWVDDNHGYIRQLPTEAEQQRSGGHGIYYHMSYWGTPADYLWICSSSPSLCSFELVKGYDNGIRDLWVINVGDIKPAEAELEFCMDLAWDVDKWQPEKAWEYSRYWAAKTFGENVADELGSIKLEYYDLAAGGKPEHVFGVGYTNGDMNERLERYRSLVDRVDALKGQIPARLQDAYFEMIEYPVKGACYMNEKIFRAKQSVDLAAAGHREEALAYAAEARKAYRLIEEITKKYNTGIAGGKWNGMMDSKPRLQTAFNMPTTANVSDVAKYAVPLEEEHYVDILGTDFTGSNGTFKEMKGLGYTGASMVVWPMDYKSYTARDLDSAPWLEYKVPVVAGDNSIEVRTLPTFPVHSGENLNVAISVDGATAKVVSLKTVATEMKWNSNVMQGFNDATVKYTAETDGEVTVKVYLMNAGIAVSGIRNKQTPSGATTLTDQLLVNADFEMGSDGKINENGIVRGVPYGWTISGTLKGNSYGINQDAANIHGRNVCWMNSTPMPEKFELSQTIPADKIEPGHYLVRCKLWVERDKATSCRMFANNNVQYFGFEREYTNLLTPGEVNSYAGYTPSKPENILLKEMTIYVKVEEGEDLKVGIRTGNKKNDGTHATDNSGWFKVDNFRIDRLDAAPNMTEEDLTLTEQVLVNHDFELYDDNGTIRENTSGETRRYTPYGWHLTGSFPGNSYGCNKDMVNPNGTNGCWFLPKEGVMPENFSLYQEIPAGTLPAGRYEVRCKLWAQEGYLGTLRLFANNCVQYYGMDIDYDKNLTEGENNTFAGYVGGENENFVLQDMYVQVDIEDNEPLRLGIKSGPYQADGTKGVDRTGWFKADYFRIHRVGESAAPVISSDAFARDASIYNLYGQRVGYGASDFARLQPGIYVMAGRKVLKK